MTGGRGHGGVVPLRAGGERHGPGCACGSCVMRELAGIRAELRQRADDGACLTVAEAAERLSVSPDTVYRLVQAGELAASRVGSLTRVRVACLVAYLDERSTR